MYMYSNYTLQLKAVNGQSLLLFRVSFIMHTKSIKLISTIILDIKSRFSKIEPIFNSVLPSDNLPCSF